MPNESTPDITALREWVGKLDTFIGGLDSPTSDSSMQFCESASDTWSAEISANTAPKPTNAAMWIFFGTATTIAQALHEAAMDQTNTPDYRDRMTGEEMRGPLRSSLQVISRIGHGWLSEGLPPDAEVTQKIADTGSALKQLMEGTRQLVEEEAAEDAAAAADPYGAILGYQSPDVDAVIVFTKVCSFTRDEHDRYSGAYARLQKKIDRELLRHVSDENERFCDVLIGVLSDLRDRNLNFGDEDAMDERRRKLRSALISLTSALHSHKDQSIRAVRDVYGRRSHQEQDVLALYNDLLNSSFEYGWLMAMRDALLHGDINAFKYKFAVRLQGEDEASVFMDREYMLRFTKEDRSKHWLRRDQLEQLESDPSILDMIAAIQPLMTTLQDQLDSIQYPDVAADAATVAELIGRFDGREGLYALQGGPGFTRRLKIPRYTRLAPRVLSYADHFPESDN
ncbi:hypothetical protein [Rhodococcoides fascians]|uniref:hypothetical protein n=1 Tax=Rhodococcoides fascians TaxID=1828 RepID=UPI00050C8080|nr:hypothetical protein [Rhodococcus fascians]